VLLDSGATVSSIDKAYAAEIGLKPQGGFTGEGSGGVDTMGFVGGVEIQIGDLTLHDINVGAFDFSTVARYIDHPLPFVLGDEVFNELAVDIDFEHHRLAFRDPAKLKPPIGAIEVPLTRVKDRAVPVSIEGGAPVPFEFDLGNGAPLDVYPAYYKPRHLLEGRRASQTIGGGLGGARPEGVAALRHVGFAGVDFTDVPTRFDPDILSGANSNLVLGNIGLPMLARFHLVIDFSHDQLFAAPYPNANGAPFAKDRLGLYLVRKDADVIVVFVSPGSPAEAAGFKAGDRIIQIDQQVAGAWSDADLQELRNRSAGARVNLGQAGGGVRQVILADFY
jgi:Aspartyl protease/PDZ domain